MGHIRLGRLPKTYRWRQVVQFLHGSPSDVAAVARATVEAAEGGLRKLPNDPALAYCFWLLTRISWASRSPDFGAALAELGLEARDDDSALSFTVRVCGHVRSQLAASPRSGPFADLASLAMRRALSETVGQEGRSFFGSSIEDLQAAFRRHSTPVRFGALAKSFFGDFLARTLRFFIDKELANNVGPGHALRDVGDSGDFTAALDLYARQSARIMEQFAEGWYGKRNWEADGRISREEAGRFVAVALRKLRMELVRSAA